LEPVTWNDYNSEINITGNYPSFEVKNVLIEQFAPSGYLYFYANANASAIHHLTFAPVHIACFLGLPRVTCPEGSVQQFPDGCSYGLLFYIKGTKPRVFNRDLVRTPIQTCRHCGKDVKDYGGHKKFLNPKGLNLTDVWDDVPPVRHRKYKNRPANELAPIILERIIKLTTNARDLICDPFAGGGVAAYVAERLKRRWIVADINDCSAIKERLISWEQGSHPEWETNKRRIAERLQLASGRHAHFHFWTRLRINFLDATITRPGPFPPSDLTQPVFPRTLAV
jgi:hypothetical protein